MLNSVHDMVCIDFINGSTITYWKLLLSTIFVFIEEDDQIVAKVGIYQGISTEVVHLMPFSKKEGRAANMSFQVF